MKCKLLVAEDELIERKVLCKTLQKYLGDLISLYEAKNGREAMELFAREAPQVAVLDIEMPGFTGLEVARKIRETDKNCAILFLTGFDKFDYARQAISVRAMEYLLKPYNEQELVFAVEEAIRQVSVQLPARPLQAPVPEDPVRPEEDGDMRTAIKARQSIPAIEPIRLIRIGKPCRMVITHAQYHHIERIIDLAHRLVQEILSIRACLRIPKGLSIFQRSFNGSISRHPFLRDATPGKRHRHSIFAILQRIQGILTNLACQGADPARWRWPVLVPRFQPHDLSTRRNLPDAP